jgi:hypothetical protein
MKQMSTYGITWKPHYFWGEISGRAHATLKLEEKLNLV